MVTFFNKLFADVRKRVTGLGGSQRQLNPGNLVAEKSEGTSGDGRRKVLRTVVSTLLRERALEITPPIMVHPAASKLEQSRVREIDIPVAPTKNSEKGVRTELPEWESTF